MLAIYVDFNSREVLDAEGNQAVHLRFDVANPPSDEEKMRAGLRVLVYDEGDSYVGIVGRGRWIDGWVADLIPGTNRELDSKEFARLQNLTRRSAIRLL